MAHKLIFEPRVADDLALAVSYYEAIATELANRFRDKVNARLDDIADRAESFPVDVAPIRFARVEKFPYLILFVVKAEFVSILAIVHGATNPINWRERI